jgi:hypothetical protein
MPLTFTAPIEQVPDPAVVAFQPPDVRSTFEVRKTGGLRPLRTTTAGWMPPPILKMTAEQAATLRRLAEAQAALRPEVRAVGGSCQSWALGGSHTRDKLADFACELIGVLREYNGGFEHLACNIAASIGSLLDGRGCLCDLSCAVRH